MIDHLGVLTSFSVLLVASHESPWQVTIATPLRTSVFMFDDLGGVGVYTSALHLHLYLQII